MMLCTLWFSDVLIDMDKGVSCVIRVWQQSGNVAAQWESFCAADTSSSFICQDNAFLLTECERCQLGHGNNGTYC